MSIVRVHQHERDFSIIGNSVLRNSQLSFRARGVLAWLLSHQADWQVSSEAIAEAGLEGRDAVRAAMTELKAAGHLVYRKERVEGGRLSTVIDVYEVPADSPSSSGIPAKTSEPSTVSDEVTGAGISVAGPTRANDAKPQVAPETGPPTAGIPGLIRSTKQEEIQEKTDTSLRSVSAAGPPLPAESQNDSRELFELEAVQRQRALDDGFRESPNSPWLFTRGQEKRDLLWEAVLMVAGISSREIPRGPGPSKARDSLNAAVAEIRRAGGSPREVVVRAVRFKNRWQRRPSPHDLARRWLELNAASEDRFSKSQSRMDAKREQLDRVVGG